MNKKLYVFLTMALLGIFLLAIPALAQDDVEDKFADDSGVGGGPAPTGGPDAFGYTWFDDSTGECAYQFTDIASTGTLVMSGDDVASGAVSLGGNDIMLYGTSYTDLNIASNGYLTTDTADTGPDLSNDCPLPAIPSTPSGTDGVRLYLGHDDLISDGYYEWFDPCPRPAGMWDHSGGNSPGCHIFQWSNVEHFGGGGEMWDMQAVLYETTNEIAMMMGAGDPEDGSGATTGIQDGAPPTAGLTYACDSAGTWAPDGAVCFFEPTAPTDVALTGFGASSSVSPLWTALAVGLLTVAAGGIFFSLRAKQEL